MFQAEMSIMTVKKLAKITILKYGGYVKMVLGREKNKERGYYEHTNIW